MLYFKFNFRINIQFRELLKLTPEVLDSIEQPHTFLEDPIDQPQIALAHSPI